MSKVAARLTLPAVIFLALSACSGADSSQSITVAGTAAEAPSSAANTTAVEQPQAPRQDNPGIPVASLPIGAPSGFALAHNGSQCVHVNWIQSDSIPQGLGVLVTGATFAPAVYRLSSFSCERPTCAGHVFRGTDLTCDLAIRPARANQTTLLNSPPVITSLTGQVLCADFAAEACKTFTGEVRIRARSLSLKLPAAPVDSPDTGIGAGSSTDTDTPPHTPVPSPQPASGPNQGG